MIISISGKMGSGKDTVGTIVQYLVHTEGIVDLKYFKEFSSHSDFNRKNFSKWQIKKFADKLKDIACMLISCTREQLEDQEFKKTFLPVEWGYLKTPTTHQLMSVREFLQKLGTDAMRNGLHENVWVNSLMADYKPNRYTRLNVTYIASNLPNWIITDTRYPNELEAVKAKEGVTIRVVRPNKNYNIVTDGHITRRATEFEEQQLLHPSETALDDATFDYEIVNDGTIEELIEKVRAILIELSII
jgi:hypothetical protein